MWYQREVSFSMTLSDNCKITEEENCRGGAGTGVWVLCAVGRALYNLSIVVITLGLLFPPDAYSMSCGRVLMGGN